MKKALITALIILLLSTNTKGLKAKEVTTEKSPYWSEAYEEDDYTHIGHYSDSNLDKIREGLMWYNQKDVYDIQVSNYIFVSYEGDMSDRAISSNFNLSVGIGTVTEEFVTPPTTNAYQYTIDGMNMGIGVKKTYSDILKESNYSLVNYSFRNGNVLNQVMATNAYVKSNNMTAAVYMKTVKVTIIRTHLRQTGPVWNVYWINDGYYTQREEIYIEHTLLPITVGVINIPEVQSGAFYLKHMNEIVKGMYKAK